MSTEKGSGKAPLPTLTPNLDIMKVAHRGVKMLTPENTLPAVKKAIELGYDYVELDVRYSRDGVPVVFHDMFLSRKTSGFGTISLFKLATIKKWDAGKWYSKDFRGTGVPTLEECLKVMQGRIKFYFDQKAPPQPQVIPLLKKYNFYPDNIVVVGLGKYQRAFLKYEPNAPLMPWLSGADKVAEIVKKYPSAIAFNTNSKSLTREMVAEAHRHGMMVFSNVLRVPDSRESAYMRRVIEYGADAIQFDRRDILLPLLEEMRRESKEASAASENQ